jgi:glycosyltransferase involved in cell wall biosynthesis
MHDSAMKSLLVITAIDFEQEANQRIHHVVRHIGKRFQEITVLYFAQFNRKSMTDWIRNTIYFSVREYWDDKVRYIRVDPIGNFPYAFGKGLLKFPDGHVSASPGRHFVLKSMNLLGIFKSISTTFFTFLVYFIKLRGKQYDVVLVEGAFEGLLGVFFKARKRTKTLVYQDFDYHPGALSSKIRRRITEKIELFCMARADLRVSTGKLLQMLRQKKLSKEVIFIPNGVNIRHWSKAQDKIPHAPTLAYMGNVIDWNGLHWILDVLPEVRQTIPDIRFMVIGRGHFGYLKKLKDKVAKFNLEDCVDFVGFVPYPDLPKYLRKADIGLATFEPNALRQYAFPFKVIEYMCARLPVIASQRTESALLIEAFNCGVCVQYGDAQQLSKAILCMFEDQERYLTYAENSKKLSQQFSWKHLMDLQYEHFRRAYR